MAIALSSLNGRVVFVTVEKMLLHVACHAFSHASPSAKSRKLSTKDEVCTGCCSRFSAIGSTHACTERNCAKNLVCQRSLVVIVVFISAVTRVPSAKNMLSSNLEALTPPKVGLGHQLLLHRCLLPCSNDRQYTCRTMSYVGKVCTSKDIPDSMYMRNNIVLYVLFSQLILTSLSAVKFATLCRRL
ncbi:hypothetical protein L3X38_001000 [Prunus dulcis]|uniref:Uncharacterized protein n=1 Tax=Prunus dulcis TaxID=3755 RepID=A0AAD4ZJX3_PRUDU|nr:hypothetical protein L3X38_001000 [Prunus dulcis]